MNIAVAPANRVRVEHVRQKGFTLLELLVVLVIIGLLAGYVGPRFFSQIGKSEVKAAAAQIDALGKALDQYRLDTGHYPSSEQGLTSLWTKPADETQKKLDELSDWRAAKKERENPQPKASTEQELPLPPKQ